MIESPAVHWLICLSLLIVSVSSVQDFIALQTEIVYDFEGVLYKIDLVLTHKEVPNWRKKCAEIIHGTGASDDLLLAGVQEKLRGLAYPDYILNSNEDANSRAGPEIFSHQASQILYAHGIANKSVLDGRVGEYFWLDPPKQSHNNCDSSCTNDHPKGRVDEHLYPERHSHLSWLPYYLRFGNHNNTFINQSNRMYTPAQIVFYQTIGANTGGTTAMSLLHRAVHELGYNAIICNETNRFERACSAPPDSSLIITGEWCHEVFAEYALNTDATVVPVSPDQVDRKAIEEVGFKGRGVQYYLGFHHGPDSCRGSSAVTDCHYLSKSLGLKGLSAYYLGCAMSDSIRDAVRTLLLTTPTVTIDTLDTVDTTVHTMKTNVPGVLEKVAIVPGKVGLNVAIEGSIEEKTMENANENSTERSDEQYQGVIKENLILIDPDFFRDYPPSPPVNFGLPLGYKFVYVQDFTKEQMPLLLQRAKIVLDLAMPGPERLSTEGILMGCIPIISNRWTGASNIDYPGVHRVDHTNATQILETLTYVANNYENELKAVQNAQFYQYALSLWRKVHNTADVVFGSSYLHFVLYAKNLHEEYVATFQILSLLYLFPLCSVDLYVADDVWFMRHHYAFFKNLQVAGYVRNDPYDPTEFTTYTTEQHDSRSYVRIKSIDVYNEYIRHVDVRNSHTVYESPLTPSWVSILVVLPIGVAFQNPLDLLSTITHVPYNEYKMLNYKDRSTGGSVSVLFIAPNCTVQNAIVPLQSVLYTQPIPPLDTTSTNDAHKLPFVESICALYRTTTIITNHTDIVYGIANTAAWQNNKIFASSLGFSCN